MVEALFGTTLPEKIVSGEIFAGKICITHLISVTLIVTFDSHFEFNPYLTGISDPAWRSEASVASNTLTTRSPLTPSLRGRRLFNTQSIKCSASKQGQMTI